MLTLINDDGCDGLDAMVVMDQIDGLCLFKTLNKLYGLFRCHLTLYRTKYNPIM